MTVGSSPNGALISNSSLGTEVEDWRAGLIASTIANANRDPKKRRKPYAPADFMPERGPIKNKEQSWEEQAQLLEMWFKTAVKKDS